MSVLRLVVLGILFYVAWRILQGMFGKFSTTQKVHGKGRTGADTKVEDVLVEDPVCHKLVPKHQAVRCRVDKKTYYFCSETCCDKFTETQRKEA